MANNHKPKQGPMKEWIYSRLEDVFQECGMKTMEESIQIHWLTIAAYMTTCPILNKCGQGKQKRGSVPCRWWWEQPMDLDVHDLIGLDK